MKAGGKKRERSALIGRTCCSAWLAWSPASGFLWTFARPRANRARIRPGELAAAVFMWLAFFDRRLTGMSFFTTRTRPSSCNGPWPLAHSYFMETKEHLVIMLLLLTTYLPSPRATISRPARRPAAGALGDGGNRVAGLMVEGHGAIVAMGAKMGLLAQTTMTLQNEHGKQHRLESTRSPSAWRWLCAAWSTRCWWSSRKKARRFRPRCKKSPGTIGSRTAPAWSRFLSCSAGCWRWPIAAKD